MVKLTSPSRIILAACILFIGGYTLGAVLIPDDYLITVGDKQIPALTAFGNLMQCIVPLFANAGLLMNAASSKWRRNSFWVLLAMGCTLWLVGQLVWTYYEVVRGVEVPNHNDVIVFLHTVPLIGALAIRPHNPQAGGSLRYNTLDFFLLMFWWVYLYAFVVLPWQFIQPDATRYSDSFNLLYTTENLVFVAGLGWFAWRTSGPWRRVYAHLFGAATVYTLGSQAINVAIGYKNFLQGHALEYHTGSLYDLPLVGSFVWLGAAGILAHHWLSGSPPVETAELPHLEGGSRWPARLAMLATLSMPLIALWTFLNDSVPVTVRDFRLLLTFGAIVVFTSLLFLRQHLVDRDQMRLLAATHDALDNLKRLQHQFVQSERLASLGQVASGAAHEINNPLTAILGYTDLVIEDRTLPERTRAMLEKIREQARRTKTLVGNLLSFAQQSPADKSLTDINPVVSNAVQLRSLDLRGNNVRIHLQAETVLPAVQCDSQQMLQVFFHIISNAVDAIEETGVAGSITVRTLREKSNVIVEFSDTGAGIKNPTAVFDPFYTTKPVGKGSGLGLSISYGIVKEHGGQITCFNRPQGGATFRVELPAATAALPKSAPSAVLAGARKS